MEIQNLIDEVTKEQNKKYNVEELEAEIRKRLEEDGQ